MPKDRNGYIASANRSITAKKFLRFLALLIGLILLGSFGIIWWATSQNQTKASDPLIQASRATVTVSTKVSASAGSTNSGQTLDLAYPNAVILNWDETTSFPNGRLERYKAVQFQAQASQVSYKEIADFYQKKLEAAGYQVQAEPEGCGSAECSQSIRLEAFKERQQIGITVRSPQVWQGRMEVPLESFLAPLIGQLKTDQTLIVVQISNATLAPLTPTPAPVRGPTALPVSAAVYLGPDNAFHRDNGNGLVAKEPSKEVKTTLQGTTFQLLWLISDANAMHLLGKFNVTGPFNEDRFRPTDFGEMGSLTDESGRTYRLSRTLSNNDGGGPNSQGSGYLYLDLGGPALAAGTHGVTFKPGAGLPLGLAEPLVISLQSFKAVGLAQGVNLNQISKANNLILQVWQGYFSPERTLLNLAISPAENSSKGIGPGGSGYSFIDPLRAGGPAANLTVTTDRGEILRPLPAKIGEYLPPTIVRLQPLPTDTKSLTIRVQNLTTSLQVRPDDLLAVKLPTVKVKLAELLKNGPTRPATILDVYGYPVKLVSEEASLDRASGKLSLLVRYELPTTPNPDGLTLQSLYLECLKCSQDKAFSGSAKPLKDSPQIWEAELKFNYSTGIDEAELRISNLTYSLPGPWQLTLNVTERS